MTIQITAAQIQAAMAAIAIGPDVDVGDCQRGVGRTGQRILVDAGLVAEGNAYWNNYSFDSADDAWAKAKAAGHVYITELSQLHLARPLSIVHFELAPYGHVGIIIGRLPDGRTLFLSVTGNRAGMVADLGNGVLVSTVEGYAASRKFRGVSSTNGTRPALESYLTVDVPDAAAVEAEKARVRRNAAYLNSLGLAAYKTAAEQDGIPLVNGDPKLRSRYYDLVQLWAASQHIWHDTFGAPYLKNTLAAERALDAFLAQRDAAPPPAPEPPAPPIPEPAPEPIPEPAPEPVEPPVDDPAPEPDPEPVDPEPEPEPEPTDPGDIVDPEPPAPDPQPDPAPTPTTPPGWIAGLIAVIALIAAAVTAWITR